MAGAALVKGLDSMFLMNALAQPSGNDDYKALVCIFMFGGNDANNIVIPITNYTDYDAIRGGAVNLAIPQDQLLPFTHQSDSKIYGLHPDLGTGTGTNSDLYKLLTNGKAAISVNTGTLIDPTFTKADYVAGRGRPYQLFSHSDQQTEWQTSNARGPLPTGFGGRLADRMRGTQSFPVITSVAGVTVFSAGNLTRPLIINSTATLRQVLNINRTGDISTLDQIVGLDQGDGRATLVQASSTLTRDALRQRADLNRDDPTFATVFPNTNLGNQLKQIAKLIKVAPDITGGINRQIFFASMGGFDTHNNQGKQGGTQGNLWKQLSEAVGAFYNATVEMGLSNKVTSFTVSDFSRTMKPANPGPGVGTDHAWGGHHFVVGDAVNGGDFYGTYPSLSLGSEEDFDTGSNPRGRWIPTQSVEQYEATLARWYGLSAGDFSYVFPNIGMFASSDLGFMASGTGAGVATTNAGGKNLISRALRL